MSKKYFRFHQGGTSGDDWFVVNPYSDSEIGDIKDPSGGHASKQITSVPSPFARIDLIKSAFKEICRTVNGVQDLDGRSIFHRMVSETLDVAQIFFEKSDGMRILEWDKKTNVADLRSSNSPKHKALGHTLALYLNKDRGYNFQEPGFDKIFLLDIGQAQMQVVGGTSPATLFFSATVEGASNIFFGAHIAFDPNDFVPFHERSANFKQWLWTMKSCIPDFSRLYPEVNNYLDYCFALMPDGEQLALNQAATLANWNNPVMYDPLLVGVGRPVQVLGFHIKKGIPQPVQSGFEICPTVPCAGQVPLALPHGPYAYGTIYTTAPWNQNYQVYTPKDANGNVIPLQARTLPYDGRTHPYLTMDDLLEPYLVKTIFPIDKAHFFDGNYSTECRFPTGRLRGYLLPLKKEFFRYYTTQDLQRMLSITERGSDDNVNYVEVNLRIPITDINHSILTYQKIYAYPNVSFSDNNMAVPDNGNGIVVERKFNVLLYSKFKALGAINYFRLGLLSYTHALNKDSLKLYRVGDNTSVALASRQRSDSRNDHFSSYYYITEDRNNNDFDYIQLTFDQGVKAVCVPWLVEKNVANTGIEYKFAVDFGTTNTHIEYTRTGMNNPTVLSYRDQVVTLSLKNDDTYDNIQINACPKLLDVIPKEFLPDEIGEDFRFPQRTVVASNNVNPNVIAKPLFDYNILFSYEKKSNLFDTHIRTNIKWSDFGANGGSPADDAMVSAYIEQLIIMMRNCVIEGGGDLITTKIRWFYPVSMDNMRRSSLETKWLTYYNRYFCGSPLNLISITESIAPYYYYSMFGGHVAHGNGAVTIDIGGGTTDITIFGSDNRGNVEVKNISSFRFAADSLFGDGFKALGSLTNGFIAKYWENIYNCIKGVAEIKSVFDDILQIDEVSGQKRMTAVRDSKDIIALFFSLNNNPEVQQQMNQSFNSLVMNDQDMKILPIIFYSAIIYHTAKLMSVQGYAIPDYLMFSGTGSKVLNMIMPTVASAAGAPPNVFERFTSKLFAAVCGNYRDVKIVQNSNPKELCCKGGLSGAANAVAPMREKIAILVNNVVCRPEIIPELDTNYGDYHYSDMNSDVLKRSTLEEVHTFLDVLYDILNENGFARDLQVDARWMQRAKVIIGHYENEHDTSGRGIAFLMQGIGSKRTDRFVEDPKLEEPLFFYPLIGMLNDLGFQIYNETLNAHGQN